MRQIQLSFTTILNQIPAYAYSLNYSLNTTLENSLSQVEIDQLKEKKLLKDPLIAVKALLTLFKRGKWNSCRKDLNQLGLKLAQDEFGPSYL